MDSRLTELFEQERERVFTPAPGFCGKVMSRVRQEPVQQTLWENALATGWPMLAAALTCVLAVIGMNVMIPATPSRGLMEIYTELEVPAAHQALYVDVDTLSTPVVVEQMILEDGE